MTRTVYLAVAPDAVLGLLHAPASVRTGCAGVLLCPPFGWDDVCSYRSRRAWAQALAQAGFPALRIELPGAGDSAGSPRDPNRLDAWTDAIAGAAGWLRAETGCARVAAIGIGLGGLVACRAVAGGAPIDDLVLWAVPARGRTLVRELRAFASLQADDPAREPGLARESELSVGGFVMTGKTTASLERLDLTALPAPAASARRVLLLERDGLAPDTRLSAWLGGDGATSVTVAAGEGYGAMMDDPRLARAPHAVIARSVAWLSESPHGPRAREVGTPPPTASDSLELSFAGGPGGAIRETPLTLELSSGRLFGVLTQPVGEQSAGVCAVLLNAGAIRRIGPNRMWVELARRWASHGVPSLRLDLQALGDSDGNERRYAGNHEYYLPELTEQTLAALDAISERGLPDRFVLAGLCSGAYWAFRAAVADPRVVGALMINLWAFRWSHSLVAERYLRRAVNALGSPVARGHAVPSPERHIRWAVNLLDQREDIESAVKTILAGGVHALAPGGRRRRTREIERELDGLRDRGTRLLLQFSRGEPLYDDLLRDGLVEREARWPNLTLDRIPGADHTFRALPLQRHVHASLDSALQSVLAGSGWSGSIPLGAE